MGAAGFSIGNVRGRIALGLLAFAMLLRVLVPAGFMPATGHGFAITLCTGTGPASVWIDAGGTLHKGKQSPDHMGDRPCAFSGFAAALDLPAFDGDFAPPLFATAAYSVISVTIVAIGRGLAAPPPPPTGPPAIR